MSPQPWNLLRRSMRRLACITGFYRIVLRMGLSETNKRFGVLCSVTCRSMSPAQRELEPTPCRNGRRLEHGGSRGAAGLFSRTGS
jgi:hypothetical protein